eukprot:TRINITY_DN3965_c0_g1_i1.p1 TRINITY_DN3965_c0_g1~~TRINITY_DN3965_c0_g1_i1.p1  ORF type:complete len:99 (+),score=15.96 TRINITY_DN3965_c0_g1_i1:98-394(+)
MYFECALDILNEFCPEIFRALVNEPSGPPIKIGHPVPRSFGVLRMVLLETAVSCFIYNNSVNSPLPKIDTKYWAVLFDMLFLHCNNGRSSETAKAHRG